MTTFDEISKRLEAAGWKKSVAGDDFDIGCMIVAALRKSGKGLILSGNVGSGKTSFVRAIMPNANFYTLPSNEDIFIPERFDYDRIGSSDTIIDDVGCEHRINDYGIHREPFADFIEKWYCLKNPGRIILTTNFSESDFADRYGDRVVSRLKDLCIAAHFKGGDKREWETPESVLSEDK